MKKLKISKRTISSLTEPQMGKIKAGATAYGCGTSTCFCYTGTITSMCGPGTTNPLYNHSCMQMTCSGNGCSTVCG